MLEFFDKLDGKGIYFIENWEKIYVTENEKDLLFNGCKYENGEIIETSEYKESQMKAEIKQADLEFQKAVKELTVEYTPEEVSSFAKKEEEAKKVLADNTYVSEFLTGTLLEWETQEELAEKIIANANAYSNAYAYHEKVLREKTKAIKEKYA